MLVETHGLSSGDLHEQTEAHTVGTVGLHHLHRIDAVAAALGHGLSVGAHHGRMDDNVLEGNLAGAVHGAHDHARNPQAHDIACGGKNLRGVFVAQIGGVHALARPALRSERPKLGAKPGIKNVLVLTSRLAAARALLDGVDGSVLPAAFIAIVHGDSMPPPQLTTDAPVLQVLKPIKVDLLPARRMELDRPVLDNTLGVFFELVDSHEPLLGEPRLELVVAAIAMHDGVIMIVNMIEQTERLKLVDDGFTAFVSVHAGELAIAFDHVRGLVENIDLLKVVTLTHRVIVRVVSRGNLDKAGTELGIDVKIGEDGDFAVDDGKLDLGTDEFLLGFVLGANRYAGVAEHGFGARGGNHDVLHTVDRLD